MTRIADRYDAFLFDLDGVLYRGSEPVAHAADAVGCLRQLGKGLAFVTNNSSRTPDEVAQRLRAVGVTAAPSEVVTSALVTGEVLGARGVRTAFVVGERGLRDALAANGVEVLAGEPREADAVVVGWDRRADYDAFRIASVLVERGAALVASNPDVSFPAAGGEVWPGAGALLAVITATTGAQAEVIGKPHAPLLEAARARAGGGVSLLVGDRLDTDIAGAVALGWDSMLVLTGVSTRDDLRVAGFSPTYTAEDLSLLVEDD
ncbi:MAG: HAD-IIA family hydrolase [Planctomycetaceae bacterium]